MILVILYVSKYIAALTITTHDSWHFNLFSGQANTQPESSLEKRLLQSQCHPPLYLWLHTSHT